MLDAPERKPGRKSVRRHLLTGVARCGRCGHYLCASYRTDRRIVYVCKACHGVSILAENLVPIVYRLVSGRLAKPDAIDLLKAELHDDAEAEALRIEANSSTRRAGQHRCGTRRGLADRRQAKIATDRINEKLAAIVHRQADQERLRVFDGHPAGQARGRRRH